MKNKNTIQNNIEKNNLRFQQQSQSKQNKGCSCSLSGCAWIILFSILIGIAVQECERSKIRLEKEKKYNEMILNKQR